MTKKIYPTSSKEWMKYLTVDKIIILQKRLNIEKNSL